MIYKTQGVPVTADTLNSLTKTIYKTPLWVIGLIIVIIIGLIVTIIQMLDKQNQVQLLSEKNKGLEKQYEEIKQALLMSKADSKA